MSEHTDETSLRALLVGVHSKLDTVLRIQQITTADRMLDRGAIQRNTRRIVSLERQVAILSGASPSHASWHPDPLEVLATEREAEAEADSVLVDDAADLAFFWKRTRRWVVALAIFMFGVGVATSCVVALILRH
jgi:hypothetical protein